MQFLLSYPKLVAIVIMVIVILVQFFSKRNDQLPNYVINLDRQPRERWKEVAEKFAPSFQAGSKPFLTWYQKKFNMSYHELKRDVEYLSSQLPHDYREEVIGFANYAQVNEIMMFLLQLRFDFAILSTTIICVDDQNMVWVFRSADYLFGNVLKLLAISVDFHRANQSVFKGTTFAGLVGLANGMLRDGYSISVDHREKSRPFEGGFEGAKEQASIVGNIWPASILLRQLLDMRDSYFDDAVRELSTFPLMAPFHFVVAGKKMDEGVIITRDRQSVVKLRGLDASNGQWFLITSNRDSEEETEKKLNTTYVTVQKAMTKMTRRGVSEANAREVLKKTQWSKTVFTTVMSTDSYLMTSVLVYSK